MALFAPADQELVPGERRVIKTRHHWAVSLPEILQTVAGVIVLYVLARISDPGFWLWQSLLWYGAVALIIRLAVRILAWWEEVIIFSDKRVFKVTGVLRRDVAQMPLSKITDLSAKQSILERLLGAGNIRFESAGQVQDLEHLKWLPDFASLTAAINELLYGDKTELVSKGSPKRRSRRAGWRRGRPEVVPPTDDD